MTEVTVQISPELWCGHTGPYEPIAQVCAGRDSDQLVRCLADVDGELCGREYMRSAVRAYARSSAATPAEDRCDHELLRRDCFDCRPKPQRSTRRAQQPGLPSGAFAARYEGRCSACTQDIDVGDWIVRANMGYRHATCSD